MLELLAQFENLPLSVFLRETGWLFFVILILHSISLGLAAGVSLVVSINHLLAGKLVILQSDADLSSRRFYYPAVWLQVFFIALVVVLISGLALLVAYPAKALTNPLFFIKLFAVAVGILLTLKLFRAGEQKFTPACSSVVCWLIAITGGRFLAYTHSVLLASDYF